MESVNNWVHRINSTQAGVLGHEGVIPTTGKLAGTQRKIRSAISKEELATCLASRNIESVSFRDSRVNFLDLVYADVVNVLSSRADFKPPRILVSCHRADSFEGHKGWGDLAFGRKISEAMLRRFPGCELTLVGGAKIEPRQKKIVEQILGVDGVYTVFIDENQPHKGSAGLARAAADKADVHIVGPSEVVEELVEYMDQNSVCITEYATNTCLNNPLSDPPVKTGIFGAGVFVESQPVNSRIPESPVIKQYIGETIPHCGFELPANGLYFSYNCHDPAGTVLDLAAMHNGIPGDIKLVCRLGREEPGADLFESGKDDGLLRNLKKKGIEKVVVVRKGQEQVFPVGAATHGGKTLYLLDPFPLSEGDMHLLIDGSGPLTGTTGDVSFSEVLASGKLPIPHNTQKSENKKDLVTLSTILLGDDHPTVEYLLNASESHSMPLWMLRELYKRYPDEDFASFDTSIASMINDPEKKKKIEEGIDILLGVLYSHYNLEHYIHGQVCKRLVHKKFPEIADYHQSLLVDKGLTQEERTEKLQQFCEEVIA